jgi:hypothetical protein
MKSIRIAVMMALAIGAAGLAHGQDRDYGRYGEQGRYARRGGGPAAQFGFEDGRRDGERDLITRHSFRPTHGDNYRHADRGYRREFGDRRYYKDEYRAAYLEGYRAGYRGGYRR